jgi:hypothetical protein
MLLRQCCCVQYQILRSVSDVHVFVLCYDGSFYESVPEDVRKRVPWQGNRSGDVDKLKPEYRLALAAGYMRGSAGCSANGTRMEPRRRRTLKQPQLSN